MTAKEEQCTSNHKSVYTAVCKYHRYIVLLKQRLHDHHKSTSLATKTFLGFYKIPQQQQLLQSTFSS